MQPSHPDAILTRDEVAKWLKVKPREVERLGVPCIDLGRKAWSPRPGAPKPELVRDRTVQRVC